MPTTSKWRARSHKRQQRKRDLPIKHNGVPSRTSKADASAAYFERPIRDRTHRKRQVADLAVGLGLFMRCEYARGDRAGGRQQTHLLPQLNPLWVLGAAGVVTVLIG